MHKAFVGHLRRATSRNATWVGRHGPFAFLTIDNLGDGAPQELSSYFKKHVCPKRVSDHGFALDWYDDVETELDAPPQLSQRIPTIDFGVMQFDSGSNSDIQHEAIKEATSVLFEKGFIPVSVTGDHHATRSILEGIKTVHTDPFALFHFSATGSLDNPSSPLRLTLQNNTIKGMMQFGVRGVDKPERILRNELTCRWMDAVALYSQGLHTIKDFRNNVPVYICVDLSALDPSCAPGVTDAVSGGLSVREVCHVINSIRTPRVVGCEITGYNPAFEIYCGEGRDTGMRRGLTSLATGKLLLELFTRAFAASVRTEQQASVQVHEMRKQGKLPSDAARPKNDGF